MLIKDSYLNEETNQLEVKKAMSTPWKVKGISYHEKDEQHIIDYINNQLPNASRYIIDLVKKDMENTKEIINEEYIIKLVERILIEKGVIK